MFLKLSMFFMSPPSHPPSQNSDAVIWHKQTALCLTLSSPTSATIHQPAILYEPLAMHILAQVDGSHELPADILRADNGAGTKLRRRRRKLAVRRQRAAPFMN